MKNAFTRLTSWSQIILYREEKVDDSPLVFFLPYSANFSRALRALLEYVGRRLVAVSCDIPKYQRWHTSPIPNSPFYVIRAVVKLIRCLIMAYNTVKDIAFISFLSWKDGTSATRYNSIFPTIFVVNNGHLLQSQTTYIALDGALPMVGVFIRVSEIAVVLGLKGR